MISAKVIARSKSSVTGKEIVTFEIIYPRFILAEFNTHRILSKNSASSRAIPVSKVLEQVRDNPAMPVHFGKNQPGMSAKEELTGYELQECRDLWIEASLRAAEIAEEMTELGLHKQVANRILEPFQYMKTVVTGTEWDNFFHLRRHPDADPNINALAEAMWQALQAAPPAFVLEPGEWHLPYVHTTRQIKRLEEPTQTGEIEYWDLRAAKKLTLEEALAISSSCCAQTSFRTSDTSIEKAQMIFAKLVESKPVHASPFEHQATPMTIAYGYQAEALRQPQDVTWRCDEGTTHQDVSGNFWSGNMRHFVQHRQLIPDNACWNYKEHA